MGKVVRFDFIITYLLYEEKCHGQNEMPRGTTGYKHLKYVPLTNYDYPKYIKNS